MISRIGHADRLNANMIYVKNYDGKEIVCYQLRSLYVDVKYSVLSLKYLACNYMYIHLVSVPLINCNT
jgi:hypothetical protein